MPAHNYFETIIDVVTGETTIRPYTNEEIEECKKDEARVAQLLEEEANRLAERKALLDRLGISEQEAKLLFS